MLTQVGGTVWVAIRITNDDPAIIGAFNTCGEAKYVCCGGSATEVEWVSPRDGFWTCAMHSLVRYVVEKATISLREDGT